VGNSSNSRPIRSSRVRDGADHELFHFAGFCFAVENLIHGERAAAVEFVQVLEGSGITGVAAMLNQI